MSEVQTKKMQSKSIMSTSWRPGRTIVSARWRSPSAVYVFEQGFRAENPNFSPNLVANTDRLAKPTLSVTVQLRALVANLMMRYARMESTSSQTRRSSAPGECHVTAHSLSHIQTLFAYHV